MHIPKWALILVTCVGALVIGWVSRMAAADRPVNVVSPTTPTNVTNPVAPVPAPTPPIGPGAPADTDTAPPAAAPAAPPNALPAAPPNSPAPAYAPVAASPPIIYMPIYVTVVTSAAPGIPAPAAADPAPVPPVPIESPAVPNAPAAPVGPSAEHDRGGPAPASLRRAPDATTRSVAAAPTPDARIPSWAPAPTGELAPGDDPRARDTPPTQGSVGGMNIMATGNNIVIASNGAIVTVGDNPDVRANTGDAAASGAIAIESDGSAIRTGDSDQVMAEASPAVAAALQPGGGVDAAPGSSPQVRMSATNPGAPSDPSVATAGAAGRAVGIAGIQDHSLEVTGDDNVLAYDDSNVVKNRTGTVNGNTGDTDTSGLNVVDAARSVVRSGDSGSSVATPDAPSRDPASPVSAPGSEAVVNPTGAAASASVADGNGVSTATGADSLVIGGDGIDDNGVRVIGDRNVVTYDDGNVAVGGSGDVNAQIGDSDTSGAVVMAVRDSDIAAGDSIVPASQRVGAQVGDPFDGDDVDVAPPASPTSRSAGTPAEPAPLSGAGP